MKIHSYTLLSFLTALIFVASCRETDEYLPAPQQEEDMYTTVPISITVGLTPITDKIGGIEFKSTFYKGDIVQISNADILAEPAVLASADCEGKDKATFLGELKIINGKSLISGSTILSATLKNSDTTLHLYNDGKPFVDIKEVESFSDDLDKYGYWTCDNFIYNSDVMAIDLVEKTRFLEFDISFGSISLSMSLGKSSPVSSKITDGTILAIPQGLKVVNSLFNIDTTFNEEGKVSYCLKTQSAPASCVPKLFSVADDKQVFFSNGNLQYRPKDGTWRLAPKQYHICFEGAEQIDVGENYELWSGDDNWNDLFGCDSWIDNRNPCLTSINDDDFPIINTVGSHIFNLDSEWSLLTVDEWDYLLFKRQNARKKIGLAEINNIVGIVLLPDYWITPDEIKEDFRPGSFDKDGGFSYQFFYRNYYSEEDWMKMESVGAVFLPLGGHRWGTLFLPYSEDHISSTGYWSWNPDDKYSSAFMFSTQFADNLSVWVSTYEIPSYGYYVRLVKTSL